MPDDIQRMLETSPLMAGLDPGLLEKMAAAAMPRRLGKGDILFRQGDRADAVWGVLDGSVAERMTGTEGKEFASRRMSPAIFSGLSPPSIGVRAGPRPWFERTRSFSVYAVGIFWSACNQVRSCAFASSRIFVRVSAIQQRRLKKPSFINWTAALPKFCWICSPWKTGTANRKASRSFA